MGIVPRAHVTDASWLSYTRKKFTDAISSVSGGGGEWKDDGAATGTFNDPGETGNGNLGDEFTSANANGDAGQGADFTCNR